MRSQWYSAAVPGRGRRLFALALLTLSGVPIAGGAEADRWVLRGTLVLGDAAGYAIVGRAGDAQQQWHAVGSELAAGTRLIAVAADHALVEQAGARRRLDFGAPLVSAPPAPTRILRIDRLRIPELAAVLDVIPHRQHGRIVGYYVNGIPEALRAEIGLQPGDLLRQVNGVPLDDRIDASQVYRFLGGDRIDLDVVRKGVPVQLVYQVGQAGG